MLRDINSAVKSKLQRAIFDLMRPLLVFKAGCNWKILKYLYPGVDVT